MAPATRLGTDVSGRDVITGLGVLYALLGTTWPLVQPTGDVSAQERVIVAVLVGGAGLVLLYGSSRLPRTDIRPGFFGTVASWSLRGVGAVVGILLFIELVGDLSDPTGNFLILSSLAAVAGFGAGVHDARAKSRAYTLEQRNDELQRTRSELEETVDRLEESERRYRTITETFPNGAVALVDADLRHTLVAGQGFETIEFSADDLRGERLHEVYSGDALETVESNYRATLEGEPRTFELDVQGRTFEFRTHPLSDGGDADAILAMSQDVTGRKQRERELAKRARQQRAIADLGQFALEADDLDDLMDEASRRVAVALDNDYCKVLDLADSGEELLLRQGVGWDDGLVGNATVSAVEGGSQAAHTLATTTPVVVEDIETDPRFSGPALLTDHGVRSGISTIIGPVDEPWGILGTHDTDRDEFSEEDVSFVQSVANVLAEAIERRQYQADLEALIDDLEESNKRLEQFAYAASHDLQEPLRMVSSYLQLIERRYEDDLDEEGREFLAFAVDGADRMRSMIDGLLQYSRVKTDADPLEPVDLDAVFSDVRADLRRRIEATDATVTAEPLPRVEGDPAQLRQVLRNLLENAIEYSGDESPTVHVSARPDGTDWIVSVSDEGIGIDPDDQDRIFEVFERAHGRQEGTGTGIGLALCERVVERHGGDIWADSEPGDGTTVSFTLPTASN
ncbi:histidine kinase [Natrinema mahii]|nr:histidine kinase [Natrinema mahii]